MRTSIDIDDELMATALKAGPYKTKKDAVEAGLRMIARAAAYQEILKWQGRLHWDDSAQAYEDRPRQPPPKLEPKPRSAAKKVIAGATHGRR